MQTVSLSCFGFSDTPYLGPRGFQNSRYDIHKRKASPSINQLRAVKPTKPSI